MKYSDIKALFKDTLNRSDITDDLCATFIAQSVQRIQRILRGPINEKTAQIDMDGSGTVALPDDFVELKTVYFGDTVLDRVAMDRFLKQSSTPRDATPEIFVRQADELLIWPTPSAGELSLVYYSKPGMFTDNESTTPLSTSSPDVIIYGALSYAADFYLDDRAPVFEQRFMTFMNEIQERAYDQETNGGIQTISISEDY